ncbi:MAG: hypothetical protein AAF654_01245 [Myxococcota bacterium]
MQHLGPTAYRLYHELALSPSLPAEASAALSVLKDCARAHGGTLGRSELSAIQDDLARRLARVAIEHRAVLEAMPEAISRTDPWVQQGDLWVIPKGQGAGFSRRHPNSDPVIFQDFGVPRLHTFAAEKNPVIREGELDQAWFAAYFALLVTKEGWNATPKDQRRSLAQSTVPERYRFVACRVDTEANQSSPDKDVYETREAASRGALLMNTRLAATNTDSVQRGLDALGSRAQQIASAAASETEVVYEDPGKTLHALAYLDIQGLESLKVSAAEEQNTTLGALPILAGMAEHLRAVGVLNPTTFTGLEFVVRTHALPSLAQLLDVMRSSGLVHWVGQHKGVSSSPMTVAGLERSGKKVEPGFGDSAEPGRHISRLKADLVDALEAASRRGEHLLVLGDGRDAAQATAEVAQDRRDVRTGYVEFTQSGLNALAELEELHMLVHSLADSVLKKLGESDLLGYWLVGQLEALGKSGDMRPLSESTVALVGYGESVGPGTGEALVAHRAEGVLALDQDGQRLKAARAAGLEEAEWGTGQPLPAAHIYVSATGGKNVLGEAEFRSMPDGAEVINYGSRGELDEEFLDRALNGRIPGVRARLSEQTGIPEHDNVLLVFDTPDGRRDKTIRIHKRGQPYFDGKMDKDPMLADIYMAGLLSCVTLAANQLKNDSAFTARVETLDMAIQRQVVDLAVERYPDPAYRPILARLQAELGAAA